MKLPVTLAKWISEFSPQLLKRDHLRVVLIAGKGGLETMDGGRWLQIVPILLGCPNMRVEAVILPSLTERRLIRLNRGRRLWRVNAWHRELNGFAAARFVGLSLDELLDAEPESQFDLITLFDADLGGADRPLLSTNGLWAASERGARIAASSRDRVAFEKHEWVLSNYSLRAPRVVITHARADHEAQGRGGHWSDVLWQIQPVGTGPIQPDPRALARLDCYEIYLANLAREVEAYPTWAYFGQELMRITTQRRTETIVGLPSGLVVNLSTGNLALMDPWDPDKLVDLDVVYSRAIGFKIPRAALADYPNELAMSFERALWSVSVAEMVDRVLNPYVAEPQQYAGTPSFYSAVASEPTAATPGSAALFRALEKEQWSAAVNMVLERPELVHAVNEQGETPAFFLVGALPQLKLLRHLGADFGHVSNNGHALIHRVAERGSAEAAQYLLRGGADVDAAGPGGVRPALIAKQCENFQVLRVLLDGLPLEIDVELGDEEPAISAASC
ncbi:ankyrin repeat domain-containing protein [Paraburkholderia youngii]|uniref:ankyrin repeat domain-containing protein n=1 Tax=Paraburkholderia youngii TaxID=2782701 RepID=UPI003D26179B